MVYYDYNIYRYIDYSFPGEKKTLFYFKNKE